LRSETGTQKKKFTTKYPVVVAVISVHCSSRPWFVSRTRVTLHTEYHI